MRFLEAYDARKIDTTPHLADTDPGCRATAVLASTCRSAALKQERGTLLMEESKASLHGNRRRRRAAKQDDCYLSECARPSSKRGRSNVTKMTSGDNRGIMKLGRLAGEAAGEPGVKVPQAPPRKSPHQKPSTITADMGVSGTRMTGRFEAISRL
ncbi:hypothetical protein K505DRAFT_320467 [Melanomma pulvis-pyrius CBS 109.77]|uniref:Uncharacterized protein n=1 Tax=Melanomma pulvis-pyrius CBS 109.77 TaxID=1314802 RepID=A0A6A6XW56_9PLEO|nr:hypothetical protein K505DRAFT_320467 [Melanomma pulvis-pyrius CBS 109.77]